jgi:hypothetical protein
VSRTLSHTGARQRADDQGSRSPAGVEAVWVVAVVVSLFDVGCLRRSWSRVLSITRLAALDDGLVIGLFMFVLMLVFVLLLWALLAVDSCCCFALVMLITRSNLAVWMYHMTFGSRNHIRLVVDGGEADGEMGEEGKRGGRSSHVSP